LKELGVRVVSGAALLAFVLLAIWLQGPLLMATVAVAAGLAAHEFYIVSRTAGYRPWYAAGLALSLLLALRAYLGGEAALTGSVYTGPPVGVEALVFVLVAVLALARMGVLWQRAYMTAGVTRAGTGLGRARQGWANLGLTLAGAVYTGGLLGYAPSIGALEEGTARGSGTVWLLLVLIGTAACDTGAYFVGSAIGKHKLIPHISPGKTWEGLAGGVLGAVLAGLVLAGPLRLSWVAAILLGVLICAAAVAGDLCESLLKRAAGVKDSGRLIPGHGGILDRVDSVLFVLLAVSWFLQVAPV
jgi:phosphatidate cytidylyltransferase